MNFLSVLDRKLLRDLSRLKGQAFAVGIIVACGVGILIMSLGSLASLEQSRAAYYERYRFADVFADVKRAPERLIPEIRNIEGVKSVAARIKHIVTLDIEGFAEPANAQLVSIPDEGRPLLNDVLLYEGRWPNLRRPDEAIVSKAFAEAHNYRPGDTVEAILNGRARDLEIVGIGDSPEYIWTLGIGSLLPDDKRFGIFWMRKQALEAAFDLDGAFNTVAVSLLPDASEQRVIDELDRLLGPYGAIGAFGQEDQLSNAFVESEMSQLAAMARIIPPVFLIVSAVLIHTILSRLIAIERQQIGLLKAFGYGNREVAWHYVKLAIILTMGGVAAGVILGRLLARLTTYLYSDTMRFPEIVQVLEPSAFLISAAAAFAAAILGALNAALKAAALKPAEGMRSAPPTVYRKGMLQQIGIGRGVDEPTRMIIRHLTRWPLRASMTMFGIAAAMALLVGTMFAFDSTDELVETIYYRTDVSDASVSFVEPLNGDALDEIRQLPGVLAAEPKRDVFVRFRHGRASERAGVIGLSPEARTKQLIDLSGNIVPVADYGLTLSSQLAKMLDVGLGDQVTLEVLEGQRPIVQVPVTALVQEYLGATAYMNIHQVNRLLQEPDVITGAFVMIDPEQSDAFNASILDRPMVASVSLRSAAIETFEETLEETISIMMTIYALIGGSIAAGVVYNAARISLAERGRELASLRVLGFTRNEAAYILLGELAILTIAAIPIGALLGAGFAQLIVVGMSTDLYRIPYALLPATRGFAGLIVLLASAGAALLVARRIRELDLIEVLKTRE